jgi:MYXO-CTERM domain-containing protein
MDATAEDLADPANWPDDPSYHYCPSSSMYCSEDSDSDGQWNYYSFIPKQQGELTLRPDESASGMSIDLAWRYSQGSDDVLIAVTDSGIRWNEGDLLESAWLNPAELESFKPKQADGSDCADILDDNQNVKLAGYDCNGDGIFTVSDYAETPALEPQPSEGHPLGDKNGNGVLDAGDIILNFSDGIDDDANGYVDDISGWDFMKDDNNPYDDTRYGHGTGEARDSTATGNDGRGEIGGCSKCRFIAMRVGDSFIADVNAFAQGVVYATDIGAKVVQSALGTVNMNAFTQRALDYAYANGVLTVASMADENARHHNMPTTANHTLPVHAIQYSPAQQPVTNVETFLDFNPCTNFGGQNLLSAAGTGCSSEAVGQLSGMSGLLFSVAQQYGPADLTGAEAQQIWFHTVDDIDVPESRLSEEEGGKYYWSQPGFDQRFGYGRVNANKAVEAVIAGKIPPEVDVVRPYWFEVLYRDQLDGPVAIEGHISAKRATSYDYIVEWAPGVQPADDAFTEIASETNIAPDVVTGADGPIALFDVRNIDTTHEPDPDSHFGENEHTITVRIRAMAHYGGDVGDVAGEMRRTYAVHSDPDMVKGFPLYLGSSGEANPKMADIDGDGRLDLIYPTSGGHILVYKVGSDGAQLLWDYAGVRMDSLRETPPLDKPSYLGAKGYSVDPETGEAPVDPALGNSSFAATPAIADVDGDGKPEIVATSYNGFIQVIEDDGTLKEGFPVRLPEVPSCERDVDKEVIRPCMGDAARSTPDDREFDIIDRGVFASPVLEDMDKDGDLDIIQAAFDGRIYVFDGATGEPVDGWPVTVHFPGNDLSREPNFGRIFTTPAVADFNDDGYPDILVGSNERLGTGENAGAAFLVDGRGTNADELYFEHWPLTLTSLLIFPLVAEGVTNAGVVGTFDGTRAAVVHGNASSPFILPRNPGEQTNLGDTPTGAIPVWDDEGFERRGVAPTSRFGPLTKANPDDVMFPLFGHPSLGDIDQDGTIDVVASGSSLTLAQNLAGGGGEDGQQLLAVWSGKNGQMLPGAPYLLEDYSFFNSHAIADLTGDNYPEIIVGSGGYFLHAFDGCGREPEGWPKFTGQWIINTPAVGDLDGDGTLEVAIGTRSGWLYAWHTKGTTDSQIQWESYHHDNRNTGNFDVPLEQGNPDAKASEPLTEALCRELLGTDEAPPLEPGGGCGSCAVGADRSRTQYAWLALLGLGIFVRRRRH